MIYIKKINTVFIRIPKNGTLSLGYYLYKNLLSFDDCYTEIRLPDKRLISQNIDQHPRHVHMDFNFLKNNKVIEFNEKTQFISIIRNPFDRLVSLYLYRNKKESSVEDFKNRIANGFLYDKDEYHMQQQHTFLENAPNKVFWKFENLQDHIDNFSKEHAISNNFPHLNQSIRISGKFFNKELKNKVRNHFKKDFDLYHSL